MELVYTDTLRITVDKTCKCCGNHYSSWEVRKLDGINTIGIWYTCKLTKPDGSVCGSTMLITDKQIRLSMRGLDEQHT